MPSLNTVVSAGGVGAELSFPFAVDPPAGPALELVVDPPPALPLALLADPPAGLRAGAEEV